MIEPDAIETLMRSSHVRAIGYASLVAIYPLELLVSVAGFGRNTLLIWWLRGAGLIHHHWGCSGWTPGCFWRTGLS